MSLESESGSAGESGPLHHREAEALRAGEAEGGRSRQRWRLIDDPVAIRALAHPLRHDLMSIIGRLGRATTADAARELGISHGLASHHLRQLAKYGFVEQVEGKDHRERPWRMVATSYNWSKARATPEGSVAVDVLEQIFAERDSRGLPRLAAAAQGLAAGMAEARRGRPVLRLPHPGRARRDRRGLRCPAHALHQRTAD